MPAGRLRTVFFLLPLCLSSSPGCRNNNNELLEAELRTRELQYHEALEEMRRIEHHNKALQMEIHAIRRAGPANVPPELAAQTFPLKRVTLGRMTSGYDQDKTPGDEGVQVYLEPRDGDEQVIRVTGSVQVKALEISPQGLKNPIGAWELGPEQLRRTWKSGLLSSGYLLTLPWQNPPASEQVRVVVRLTLSDGRTFEADRDVRVRLIPGSHPRPEAGLEEVPGPALPEAEPLLPNPRPLDPAPKGMDPASEPDPGPPIAVTPTSAWVPVPLGPAVRIRAPVPTDAPGEAPPPVFEN